LLRAESPLRFGLAAKLGKPCRGFGKIRLNLLELFCRLAPGTAKFLFNELFIVVPRALA
jgi:hypothetical protein